MSPDQFTNTTPVKETAHVVEQFLFKADINRIRCVDERQDHDDSNGVELPGGIYSVIDAIKQFKGVGEDEAWTIATQAGIPVEGHGDEHHGDRGCGYAKLIEDEPETVLALESIPASQRASRIRKLGGTMLTMHGDHKPTHAVINYRKGVSIDPDQAMPQGFGIFNFDYWVAKEYGTRLEIDPSKFADHMLDVYKKTVTKLTRMTTFIELR